MRGKALFRVVAMARGAQRYYQQGQKLSSAVSVKQKLEAIIRQNKLRKDNQEE